MQILRTSWNPQIPIAAPTAANSGYTWKQTSKSVKPYN